MASEVLKLDKPPSIPDIPALCNMAIITILSKASKKLMDSMRKKEDTLYKNSPKRYHHNLITAAGLQSCAKNQPTYPPSPTLLLDKSAHTPKPS